MSFENLVVFQKSYELAMKVYTISNHFPKEEKYSLTDQVRRSSRAVCANIAEGYRKKYYPKTFISRLVDADGECSETIVHLMFAKDCSYINEAQFIDFKEKYLEVGKIINAIIRKPENILRFNP